MQTATVIKLQALPSHRAEPRRLSAYERARIRQACESKMAEIFAKHRKVK